MSPATFIELRGDSVVGDRLAHHRRLDCTAAGIAGDIAIFAIAISTCTETSVHTCVLRPPTLSFRLSSGVRYLRNRLGWPLVL